MPRKQRRSGLPTALSDDIVAKGGSFAAKYILVNNNEDPAKYFDGGSVTLTGRGSTDDAIKTGFGTATQAAVTAGPWNDIGGGPGPEPTPEPTSGLLMLVGLAGLALKRKVA